MTDLLMEISLDRYNEIDFQTDMLYSKSELNKFRTKLIEVCIPLERVQSLPNIKLELLDDAFDKLMKEYKDPSLISYFDYELKCGQLIHNYLRLTNKESQNRDIWRFVSLYFINVLIFRKAFKGASKELKNNQFLLKDKLNRSFFPRVWHTAEITREGEIYSSNSDFYRADFNTALLERSELSSLPKFGFLAFNFLLDKYDSEDPEFRYIYRAFFKNALSLPVPQPFSSLLNTISFDLDEFAKWINSSPSKKLSGPKDLSTKDNLDEVENWFEIVLEVTVKYLKFAEEKIKSAMKDNPKFDEIEMTNLLSQSNKTRRLNKEEIKFIFNGNGFGV